ncbi:MAG: methyltransferase domain-containing protein [Thermomicrobiales bacterium]
MVRMPPFSRSFVPTPRQSDAIEILDAPDAVPADTLARNLRDIRRVNRFAGGTAVVLRHLPELLVGVSRGTPVTLLDIATGSGDIPRALIRWGGRRGYDLRVQATDVSEEVLAVARRETAGEPAITLEACDARALPYPTGAFDIAICSLALHHFRRAEAVQVLAEMGRVARRGVILNDLTRTWSGYVGAWLLGNVTTRNPLTRHDAPLSILRAFTPDELAAMAREAGLTDIKITSHLFWRMALLARRSP